MSTEPNEPAKFLFCTRPRPRFDDNGEELPPSADDPQCGMMEPCAYHNEETRQAMLAAAATTLDEGLGSAMAETVTEREAASAHDAGYLAGAAKTLDVVAELAAANELSEQHLADKLAETAKYWQREMAKLERRISKWVAKQRRAAKALRKLRARLDYAAAQLSDTSAAERRSISRRRRP